MQCEERQKLFGLSICIRTSTFPGKLSGIWWLSNGTFFKFQSGSQIGLNYLQLAHFQLSLLTKLFGWSKTFMPKVWLADSSVREVTLSGKLRPIQLPSGFALTRGCLILLLSLDLLRLDFFFNWFTAALKVISGIFLPPPPKSLKAFEMHQWLRRNLYKNFNLIRKSSL